MSEPWKCSVCGGPPMFPVDRKGECHTSTRDCVTRLKMQCEIYRELLTESELYVPQGISKRIREALEK